MPVCVCVCVCVCVLYFWLIYWEWYHVYRSSLGRSLVLMLLLISAVGTILWSPTQQEQHLLLLAFRWVTSDKVKEDHHRATSLSSWTSVWRDHTHNAGKEKTLTLSALYCSAQTVSESRPEQTIFMCLLYYDQTLTFSWTRQLRIYAELCDAKIWPKICVDVCMLHYTVHNIEWFKWTVRKTCSVSISAMLKLATSSFTYLSYDLADKLHEYHT